MEIDDLIFQLNCLKLENERVKQISKENEKLKESVDALAQEFLSVDFLKKENAKLKQTLEDLAGEFIQLEELKKENEQLKTTIKSLRQQLDVYRKHARKQYESERDYLPYHERED